MGSTTKMDRRFEMRLSEQQIVKWDNEAERFGMSLAEWVRMVCDKAVCDNAVHKKAKANKCRRA